MRGHQEHHLSPTNGYPLLAGTLLATGFLILPLLPGCETRPAVADAPIRFSDIDAIALDQLTDRYLDLVWSLRPALANGSRCPRSWQGRTVAGRAQIIAAGRETRNLLSQAEGIRVTGLTRSQRMDRAIMIDLLNSILVDLEQVRTWSRDPGIYLEGIRAALAMAGERGSLTTRSERTRLRLLAIPPLLERTRTGLASCPRPFVEAAAAGALELAESLEKGQGLPHPYQETLRRELAAARDRAATALRGWAAGLETDADRLGPGRLAMGPAAFALLLRHREGISTPPQVMLADLTAREEGLTRQLDSLDGPPPPGNTHILPAAIAGSRHLVLARRILPADLLGGADGGPAPAGFSPQPRLAGLAYPGLQALDDCLAGQEEISKLRKGHQCRTYRLGWQAYAEELLFTDSRDREIRRRITWRRWRRCLEARIALALQLEAITLDQAVEELSAKLALPPHGGRQRAVELLRDPFQTLGWLGRDLLIDQREKFRRQRGDAFLLSSFHRRVLEAGPIPLDRLARLLAEE